MTIIIWFVGSKFYFCLEFIIKNLNKIYFMKKALLALSLVAASTGAFAQLSFAPVVGLNMANMSYKLAGESLTSNMKMGVHLGVMAKYAIGEKLAIMPGVLFSMKGTSVELLGTKNEVSLNTLEIPVNISYGITSNEEGLYVFAGPYLGIGLSVKSGDSDIEFGDDAGKMKRMDFGANAGLGYKLPMGLMVQAQYGIGFANLAGGGDSDNSVKNNVIGITVGYFLGGNK